MVKNIIDAKSQINKTFIRNILLNPLIFESLKFNNKNIFCKKNS
jgi:hypothetical protein